LALLVEGAIRYEIHPLTAINTTRDAVIVAFSFWLDIIVGYLSVWIQKHLAKEEEPDARSRFGDESYATIIFTLDNYVTPLLILRLSCAPATRHSPGSRRSHSTIATSP
jgi:hypothetical protein